MPTFDFRCTACENMFEFSRPFGSKETPKCPACGNKKTEKQMSAPTVVFKGSGWYKTEGRAAEKSAPVKDPTPSSASADGLRGASEKKEAANEVTPRSSSGQAPGTKGTEGTNVTNETKKPAESKDKKKAGSSPP